MSKADTTFKREKRGKSKIELAHPILTDLVSQLGHGAAIYYRGGDWWLEPWDLQITFRLANGRECDLMGKARTAEQIIRGILAAREQPAWGTLAERAARVWLGLKTLEYRRGYYCHYRHESMDGACKSRFISSWRLSIDLVGEAAIVVDNEPDHDVALAKLAVLAHDAFGMVVPVECGRPG